MKKPFDYWQDHSETFLVMANRWDKRKTVDQPDGFGKKTGNCGDTVAVYLSIKDGVIDEINYELEGCANTNACCNALASLAEGKLVEQSWAISPQDIIDLLETLPADHHHCAELTIGTFYLALADWNGATDKQQTVA